MRSLFESLFRLQQGRALEALAGVPGPTPVFLVGNGLDLLGGDLHVKFEEWRARYGDLMRFFLFSQPSLLTAKPEHVVRILVDRPDEWIKNVPRGATAPTGGESVFRAPDRKEWAPKRAAHPFEQRWIAESYDALVPRIRELVRARLDARVGQSIDLYEEILRVTFDAFAVIVLGETLPPEAFDDHERMLKEVGNRGALPVPFSPSPFFWWRRWRWRKRIASRIARGSLGERATDLVSMMSRAGTDMTKRLVHDELGNVFLAGMKNAALAASSSTFLLTKHTLFGDRVRAELDAAGLDPDRTTLLALPHLDRSVKEAGRLYPSVAGFVREVKPGERIELDGAILPPRTQVFLVSWIVHRHPEIWADPTRFDPDRFLVEPKPGTYFPFGLGLRFCVGRDLTILVAKTITAEILSRFEVALDPAADYETKLVAVLTIPKRGVPCRLTRRATPRGT